MLNENVLYKVFHGTRASDYANKLRWNILKSSLHYHNNGIECLHLLITFISENLHVNMNAGLCDT